MLFVIDNHIPYIAGVFEQCGHSCVYLPPEAITAEICQPADCLVVRTRTKCDAALLEGSNVKCIATATIGYDHINTNYCKLHGITVFSSPGCNAEAVRQWVFAAINAWAARRGKNPVELTLGIVGVGHVGGAVKKHATANGMKVVCCDPPLMRNDNTLNYVELSKIAQEADIVTFHTPLTRSGNDATYHLCGKQFLDIFASHGYLLLNASRGGVLDECCAKTHPNIDFAIDCWEGEPNIDIDFLNQTLIATPHIAGYSAQGKANATTMVVRQISKLFGLGLDNWTAQCPTDSETQQYDIMADDKALRNNPCEFEQLRSSYKFR